MVFVIAYVYALCKNTAAEWNLESGSEARSYAVCKPFTYTLIVKERHPCLLKAIEVKAHRHSYTEKLPDVYVYNGVSDGNMNSGVATKVSGGYHVVQGAFTGEGTLYFKYVEFNRYGKGKWSSENIVFLSVPPEDFEFAKQDAILSKYLVDSFRYHNYLVSEFKGLTEEEARCTLHINYIDHADLLYIRKWLGKQI